MKRFLVLAAAVVALAVPAGAGAAQPASVALPGFYEQTFGQTGLGLELNFEADGTWDAGFGGLFFTGGTWFTIGSSTVVLAGDPACNFQSGFYQWRRAGIYLYLKPVNDPCTDRLLTINNPPKFQRLGPPVPTATPTLTALAAGRGW